MFFTPVVGWNTTLLSTYIGHTGSATRATSFTFSSVSIGTSAADRLVIVGMAGRSHNDATVTFSCTIGGTSAAIAATTSPSDSGVALAYLLVPTGTTANIVVSLTGGSTEGCDIFVYTLTGYSSASPFGNGHTDGGTSGATTISATANSPSGGVAFIIATGLSYGFSSANVGTADYNTTGTSSEYTWVGQWKPTTAATPQTFTMTYSGSADYRKLAVATWR